METKQSSEVILRKHPLPCRFGLVASICITIALAIWSLHNGPVNAAVDSWTLNSLPANWMTYRDRWEYAHAARAGFYMLGLSALMLAILSLDSRAATRSPFDEKKIIKGVQK